MKSPDQLLDKLNRYEDTASAIAAYREAGSYIKRYREFQDQALDCARAGMSLDGVVHAKTEAGSAGWTQPKTEKLDRAKWRAAIDAEPELLNYENRFLAAKAALEDAQDRAGCLVLGEPRFYIR